MSSESIRASNSPLAFVETTGTSSSPTNLARSLNPSYAETEKTLITISDPMISETIDNCFFMNTPLVVLYFVIGKEHAEGRSVKGDPPALPYDLLMVGAIQATMTIKMVVSLHQLRWVINRREECSDEAFLMGSYYNFRYPDCNTSDVRAMTLFSNGSKSKRSARKREAPRTRKAQRIKPIILFSAPCG